MSFYDKFGKTVIKGEGREGLSISWDFNGEENKVFPVLLYTPNLQQDDHFHIELTRGEAGILYYWLDRYLTDKED